MKRQAEQSGTMRDDMFPRPHVLIFPLPLQGPVSCMLKLAELLCLHGIRVTFLNTLHIQNRLLDCTYYTSSYPTFRFHTVPDGLPEDNPRIGDYIPALIDSMDSVAVPIFRDMVSVGGVYGPGSADQVTLVVADGLFAFAADVTTKIGLPLLYFDTISPCGLWTYICLPKLIESGEVPFKDDNLDQMMTGLDGMEGIMRRRDLPSFCRWKDLDYPMIQLVFKEVKHLPLAQGFIFNSFQQLEDPILSQFLNINPKIYTIGPLHTHLTARLAAEASMEEIRSCNSATSIWIEDKSCISWLDKQPFKSVIYVSIGSLAVITKDQLLEIWHGLVNSGTRFLWVQRLGSILGADGQIPAELSRGVEERGYIVSWAPQKEVLAHPAVGGFLTHSGWNSTLESIAEGKPMICWPQFVDQQVNSRYVEEVWKIGVDMKDKCDRVMIARMVREVMEERKDEFLHRAEEMSRLANQSVSQGGSSFVALDRLIEDIKFLRIKCMSVPHSISISSTLRDIHVCV